MNFSFQSTFSFLSQTSSLSNGISGAQHKMPNGHHHASHHARKSVAEAESATGAAAESSTKTSGTAASPAITTTERQSVEQTAKNILNHVQQGIESLKAQGASQERIDARLEAAKEGIAKGYEEARDMLDGMGLMTDELAADIDAGEALVYEGLDDIAAGNTPALLAPPQANMGDDQSSDESQQSEPSSGPANAYDYSAAMTRTSNRLSLEVMTQDGDRISVNFRERSGSLDLQAGGSSLSVSGFSSRFDMEVKGFLDEGELQALETLFSDVQKLSDTFFNGDLGAALEEAMNLGFDGNELASMSLDLRQRSFSSVSRAYGAASPQLPTERLAKQPNMIAEYVDSYISALDRASPLTDARDTLQKMLDQLVPEDDRLGIMQRYHEGLNRLI
ncbi:MAG: DUF5610 domain-containing protein [Thalassolituus sp.]